MESFELTAPALDQVISISYTYMLLASDISSRDPKSIADGDHPYFFQLSLGTDSIPQRNIICSTLPFSRIPNNRWHGIIFLVIVMVSLSKEFSSCPINCTFCALPFDHANNSIGTMITGRSHLNGNRQTLS